MSPTVSVIVPVWRDAAQLCALVQDLEITHASEVIVAGTSDEIDELAELAPPHVTVTSSALGRATQMNAGAAVASGDWLLFLHADSKLPHGWLNDLHEADRNPSVAGGAFRFALDSGDWRARFMEWGVRQRIRWLDLPYGDQGLFVRRTVFERLGGFPDIPLMEDVAFVRALRACGRLHHSTRPVRTSPRRWERDGWFRRMLTNWLLVTAYSAGISPRRVARWYAHRSAAAVAVLARDPAAPGKSRLWRALRLPPDPSLQHALLADTLACAARTPGADRVLVHTGSRRAIAPHCPPGWTTLGQRGNDLGERMASAFADLFRLGHARVVLVGSDLPTLPHAAIEDALLLLRRRADVVIGPAADGGYYLIGLREPHPALFERIQWGAPDVLDQTIARARALRLRVASVRDWYDVDDDESLRRAAADPRAVRTAAWWTDALPRRPSLSTASSDANARH